MNKPITKPRKIKGERISNAGDLVTIMQENVKKYAERRAKMTDEEKKKEDERSAELEAQLGGMGGFVKLNIPEK